MPTAVLVNDTSLFSSHFGCQLVGQTIREQLSRVGVKLVASFPLNFDQEAAAKYFQIADLVIINGEGSIHHGRNVELLELANRYPCALINCVFQDNGNQSVLKKFRYIAARESLSANEIRRQGASCDVVPDAIFGSMLLASIPKTHADLEVGFTDNVTSPLSGFSPESTLVFDSLQKLSRCQTLCAGRFHAAVAASVLKIPFSTWESNTWKTLGMMSDMGVGHLHFKTQVDAARNIPTEFDSRIGAYVDSARIQIESMFETLADIASGNVSHSKAA